MHNYGSENISKAQIQDAVEILNTDFRKLNADTSDIVSAFTSIAADCEIEFKLATIDDNGNCTDGITRTATSLTFIADDDIKTLIQWDPSMYLNVWVVEEIESGAGGYSYLPGVSSWKDGIVIRNDQLGSIGTSCGSDICIGSLTHEVGHYLNLKHTWGGTNSPGDAANCSDDDDVSDTPNCIGVTSCNLSSNTCGYSDNVQNYMDYSGCYCMFTEGQKSRMQAALTSSTNDRDNLWSTSNLKATGTYTTSTIKLCQADFTYDQEFICPGTTVNFTDDSWNGTPASWSWTFTGGSPSSSTDSAPSITYNTAGDYNVTLSVTNSTGTVSATKTSIIHVASSTADFGPDFTNGFEDATNFTNYWDIVNIDAGNTWSRTSSAFYEGSYSLKMSNYGNTEGSVDEIISPSIDLSYITDAKLKFKLAYAQQTSDDGDALKVYASTDCGESWSLRFSKQGSSIATTTSYVTSAFSPSPSQWEEYELSFTSSLLKDNVKLKFEFTNDGGNNLYIDALEITGTINGIEDLIPGDFVLDVIPNPINEKSILKFELSQTEECSLIIYDALGHETKIFESKEFSKGEQLILFSNYLNQNGFYFLKLRVGEKEYIKKVVK
jgi:PKD repeat protein